MSKNDIPIKAIELKFDAIISMNDYLEKTPAVFQVVVEGDACIGKKLGDLCFNIASQRPRAFRII